MQKNLVEKLIDKCTEAIEEVKLANITAMDLHFFENENNYKYGSCRVYIALMIVVFIIFLESLVILFITIGLWLKIMFLALNLILIKKRKFAK